MKKLTFLFLFGLLLLINIAYSIDVELAWDVIDGGIAENAGYSVVVDSLGNSYVAGIKTNGVNNDIYIVSYDDTGGHRWNKTINYNNSNDFARKIVISNNNNIYVVGAVTTNVATNYDAYVISYTSEGVHRWNNTIKTNNYDSLNSVTIDESENLYITGQMAVTATDIAIYVISYNSSGANRWNRSINFGSLGDAGMTIVVDGSGSSYVAAQALNSTTTKLYLIKYNSTGGNIWNNTINFSNSGISLNFNCMVIDTNNNIYIVGSVNNGVTYEMYVTSYNSSGTNRWNNTVDPYSSGSTGNSIVVDGSGDSYILGAAYNGINSVTYLISYDTNGVFRWNNSINENLEGSGGPLAIDSSYNIYLAAESNYDDIYVASYDSSGVARWNMSLNNGVSWDSPVSIAADNNGNTFVTGYLETSQDYFYLVKISEIMPAVQSSRSSIFPVYGFFSIIITFLLLFGYFFTI